MALAALLRSWVRLPMGANFRLGLKKKPSSVPRQNIGLIRPSPGRGRSHMGYVWVGQGFGGFLHLHEKVDKAHGLALASRCWRVVLM